MALNEKKITDAILQTGVISAPDKLTGTASENKAVFDRLIRNIVAQSINPIIDELISNMGAATVGATVSGMPGNTIQDLLSALKNLCDIRYTKTEAETLIAQQTNTLLKNVTVNNAGVWTFTRKDGTAFSYDTKLEKIVVNFKLEGDFLVLSHDDGTLEKVSLSAFKDHHNFNNTDTISWAYTGEENNRTFTANIKPNSIKIQHLALDAVSKIEADVNSSAQNAAAAQTAKIAAENAQSVVAASAAKAETNANAAANSKAAAETAQAASTSAKTDALSYSNAANSAKTAAEASKNSAAQSAADALASKNTAVTAQTNSSANATAAAKSATAAATDASTATTQATNAANSASSASTSATSAATSATRAGQSETNAANSAASTAGIINTATTQANKSTTEANRAKTEADRAKTQADRASSIVGGDYATHTELTTGDTTTLTAAKEYAAPKTHTHTATEISITVAEMTATNVQAAILELKTSGGSVDIKLNSSEITEEIIIGGAT